MIAYILSSLIVTIFGYVSSGAFKYRISKINKDLMKKMIKYSSVLIPTTFMWWIMNSSDRIMVTSLIGESANGIYAVSYKLPTLLSVIIAIFNQAWLFSAIDERDSSDNEVYTNKVYKMIFCVLNIIGLLLLLGCRPFMKIYVASEYYVAWKYMSFLIVGVVFQSLSTFISTSYSVNKDNKGFLYSGSMGAIVNIVLNFILIPLIGVYGAALATCVSYISVFAYRVIDTKKYIRIHIFEKKYVISYFVILIAAASLYIDFYIGEAIIFVLLVLFCILFRTEIGDFLKIVIKRKKI